MMSVEIVTGSARQHLGRKVKQTETDLERRAQVWHPDITSNSAQDLTV